MARLAIVLLALTLAGCKWFVREVLVEVERVVYVQVATQVVPPPELLVEIQRPVLLFVAPDDAAATSALTAEGERALRSWVADLEDLLAAWRAWGHNGGDEIEPDPQKPKSPQ